jgi:hypothetical protein
MQLSRTNGGAGNNLDSRPCIIPDPTCQKAVADSLKDLFDNVIATWNRLSCAFVSGAARSRQACFSQNLDAP